MIDELPRLKREVEALARQKSESVGEFRQTMKQIKEEFSRSDLKAAKLLLRRLHRKMVRTARREAAKLKAFKAEFGDDLDV